MDARLSLLALAVFCSQALAFEHGAWDGLLRKHVIVLDGGNASQVRYAGLLADAPEEKQLIQEGKAKLGFLDYDWTLNDSRSSSPR